MCCHGEHSGDAQSHSGRGGVHVDPEGDPGKNYNEEGGDIHLDQVVAHLPLQVEAHLNTSKFTCGKRDAAQTSIPISKQLFAVFTFSLTVVQSKELIFVHLVVMRCSVTSLPFHRAKWLFGMRSVNVNMSEVCS